ncbi:uncharacterized protein KQ657_003539 [Scheffersomyces spartinae]|uniref:WLM domain-containing protein n=1 Tax=Scheffersomyces spartinae TaxID=45513 RepID=A0A9P8AG71_9ASCO|nr:uncharacterized protein KQ657_003539 [Scheffersomyces spartinae]KAG7191334.1 hypothetical protein KQ657_003539 [Scheffersomyces spartinae]
MVLQGIENIHMRTAAGNKASRPGNSNIGTKVLKLKLKLNPRTTKKVGPQKPSPVSAITKIGLMKRFFDPDVSLDMLHELARLVGPLMHRHKFTVGVLCEFYPSNPSLLGLNVDRGSKIMLRLRHPGSTLYLPMNDIVGTLLHELTHNLYGAHDAQFYKFLDQLKEEYADVHFRGLGPNTSEYVCEENKLGHSNSRLPSSSNYVSVREKRLKAVTKTTYNSERRKLGTTTVTPRNAVSKPRVGTTDLRNAILAATERRIADSKWCSDQLAMDEDVTCDADLITVVDLTNHEYEDDDALNTPTKEIIVIDGCETYNKFSQSKKNDNLPEPPVVTQLLEPFESKSFPESSSQTVDNTKQLDSENTDTNAQSPLTHREPIGYLVSVSPSRSFFNEGIIYPRRKYVANLTFEEIIRRSREIEIHLLERQEQPDLKPSSEAMVSRSGKHKSNGRFDKVIKKARPSTPSTRSIHKSLIRKTSPAPEPQSHAKTI